jgi:hypothetical protein
MYLSGAEEFTADDIFIVVASPKMKTSGCAVSRPGAEHYGEG